jgi:hypothetical protein
MTRYTMDKQRNVKVKQTEKQPNDRTGCFSHF